MATSSVHDHGRNAAYGNGSSHSSFFQASESLRLQGRCPCCALCFPNHEPPKTECKYLATMNMLLRLFLVLATITTSKFCPSLRYLATSSNGTVVISAAVPSLDDLAGDWQNVSQVYNRPSVEGFWGGVATTSNVLSFTSGTFPPLSQGGEAAILKIGGYNVSATRSRWYPYQVVRSTSLNGLNISSTTRIGFEQNLVMLQLVLSNAGSEDTESQLQIDFNSYWRCQNGTWPWSTPRPSDADEFTASSPNDRSVLVQDKTTSSASAFTFSSPLELTRLENGMLSGVTTFMIKPSQTWSMDIVLAVSNSSQLALIGSEAGQSNFSQLWSTTKSEWSYRYEQVFEPNNTLFSGSLPILETDDSAISKLWYHSVISILSTMRTNLEYRRVYATEGPDEGTTIVYAWDTSLWAGILALLDPMFLKEQTALFLKQGVYSGYAIDYLTEKLVGPWYSANDFSVFLLMLRYVNMTGDYEWLRQPAGNGSTNLEQLGERATHWQSLKSTSTGLADYGGLSNLLEEVPTYTNMVPSLNAANVWMMEQYGYILQAINNSTDAEAYFSDARDLAQIILKMYAGPESGYWYTFYPNGTRQEVRHVYDFNIISLYMNEYLNASVKADMQAFVDGELYTGHWLRALSAHDLVANVSMRPDHGSNGAYTSWPALAAAGLSQLGNYPKMVDYLRSFSSVLSESTWAQCYQLIDPQGPQAASAAEAAAKWAAEVGDYSGIYFGSANGTAPVGLEDIARISLPDQGELFNENNGASFADVILTYVFGWMPDGTSPAIRDPQQPRGTFRGSLSGVRGPNGRYYRITADEHGVNYTEEQ